MNKHKYLIKNTIIMFFGRIATQFVSFLLLPIITLYLSTEEYGYFDLITTCIILFTPIISINLEMAVFRFLIDYRDNENKKREVIFNSCIIISVLTFIVSIILIVVGLIFNTKHMFLIILLMIFTITSNYLLQTTRGLGDNVSYSIASVIAAIANITFTIFLLKLKLGLEGVLIANAFANLLISIYIFIKKKIYNYISIKYKNITICKKMLKYSIPLVPNGLLWWVISSSDRLIVSTLISVSANGIYSISNKFSNIINSLYAIFNMSWTESVSLYINDKDDFLENTFNNIFNFVCCLCLLTINGMFIIFPLLINKKYDDAYMYIPILIISSIFNMLSSNLSAIYIAKKETKAIAKSTIFSSLINVLTNLMFIKYIGLYAASISTLIAFFLLFIGRFFDIQRFVKIRINMMNVILYIILFTISYFVYVKMNIILSILMLIISITVVIIINKDLAKNIMTKFKRRCGNE